MSLQMFLLLVFAPSVIFCERIKRYQRGCGGHFTSPEGQIASPGFPGKYPHNKECGFEIEVDVGYIIALTFQSLDVENQDDCDFDSVEVFDGSNKNSTSLGKLCGRVAPSTTFKSTSNVMFVHFMSDHINNGKGFYATYTSHDVPGVFTACGGLFTSPEGQIASPGFPGKYPNNKECGFEIEVDVGHIVALTFQSLDVENQDDCDLDSVEVFDGSDKYSYSLGKICGRVAPSTTFTSTSNVMFVHFKSDNIVNGKGFQTTYTSPAGVCGGTFTRPEGQIASPASPGTGRYPHNADCGYVIEVEVGLIVSLRFQSLDVQNQDDCDFDSVEVFDGSDENGDSLGVVCGEIAPTTTFKSTSNVMFVRFISDNKVNGEGFRATYSSAPVCGENYSGNSGQIKSPGYPHDYRNNLDCGYHIQVDEGRIVELSFDDFDVENHLKCRYDSLEIYDGVDTSARKITQLCGYLTPEPVRSTGRDMYILFHTDRKVPRNGYSANYRAVSV